MYAKSKEHAVMSFITLSVVSVLTVALADDQQCTQHLICPGCVPVTHKAAWALRHANCSGLAVGRGVSNILQCADQGLDTRIQRDLQKGMCREGCSQEGKQLCARRKLLQSPASSECTLRSGLCMMLCEAYSASCITDCGGHNGELVLTQADKSNCRPAAI